jgi:hypothetical protein
VVRLPRKRERFADCGLRCLRHRAENEGGDFVDGHLAGFQRELAVRRCVDVEADPVGAAELFGVELHAPAVAVLGGADAVTAIIVAGDAIAARPGDEPLPHGAG